MRIDRNRNALIAAAFASLAALMMCAAMKAQAAEIIPSFGITEAKDADNAKPIVGLALRGTAIPSVLDLDVRGQYRQEERFNGALKERMWPITASAWLTPLRVVYAGAGVGWYNTTVDYQNSALKSDTSNKFGVHAGAGLRMPMGDKVALDLNGRYVWLKDQETQIIPQKFNPDFWDVSAGLAFSLGGSSN
jgi:hypothetical protein